MLEAMFFLKEHYMRKRIARMMSYVDRKEWRGGHIDKKKKGKKKPTALLYRFCNSRRMEQNI
jgi:hypothetical protein